MDIKCPHCGTEYEVEHKDMHHYVKCEVCKNVFIVGAPRNLAEPKTSGIRRRMIVLISGLGVVAVMSAMVFMFAISSKKDIANNENDAQSNSVNADAADVGSKAKEEPANVVVERLCEGHRMTLDEWEKKLQSYLGLDKFADEMRRAGYWVIELDGQGIALFVGRTNSNKVDGYIREGLNGGFTYPAWMAEEEAAYIYKAFKAMKAERLKLSKRKEDCDNAFRASKFYISKEEVERIGQAKCEEYAKSLFSSVCFDFSRYVYIQASLKQFVESSLVTDRRWEMLKNAQEKGDWLGMVNAMLKKGVDKYPSQKEIDRAYKELLYHDWNVEIAFTKLKFAVRIGAVHKDGAIHSDVYTRFHGNDGHCEFEFKVKDEGCYVVFIDDDKFWRTSESAPLRGKMSNYVKLKNGYFEKLAEFEKHVEQERYSREQIPNEYAKIVQLHKDGLVNAIENFMGVALQFPASPHLLSTQDWPEDIDFLMAKRRYRTSTGHFQPMIEKENRYDINVDEINDGIDEERSIKELESRTESCKSCGGSGSSPLVCTKCKGNGKVVGKNRTPCPTCSASDTEDDFSPSNSKHKGQIKKLVTCGNCRGTGQVQKKCGSCNGRKKVAIEEPGRMRRYERCGTCNGSGYGYPEMCPKCNGDKKLEVWQTCPTCKGRGEVTNGSKVTCPTCNGKCKLKCERCGGRGFTYRPKQ